MSKIGFTKKVLTVLTPVIAGSAFIAPAAEAATFARSQSDAVFSQFSIVPTFQEVFTDTQTETISANGEVSANSEASAEFIAIPPTATNFSKSEAQGSGEEYSGFGGSLAQVIGNFLMTEETASQPFAFNFELNLNLATEVDDSATETANALGEITFLLYGGTDPGNLTLLDFFTVGAELNSSNSQDFLVYNNSANVSLSNSTTFSPTFGGLTESATAFIKGSYQRNFEAGTYLTLVETKVNEVSAQAVPEPSTILAIALSGAVGAALKRHRNTKTNCE